MDRDLRTLWCGNLSNRVTEDILYELFLQVNKFELHIDHHRAVWFDRSLMDWLILFFVTKL